MNPETSPLNRSEEIHMNNKILIALVLALFLSACGASVTPVATETAVPTATVAATATQPSTPTQTSAPTDTPAPTPLPGALVLPLDTLGNRNPWLPYDKSAIPGVAYFAFNTHKPPFNSALVRQAFAAAVDRQVVIDLYTKYGAKDLRPATSLTPPEVLGRDLYDEVGIPFDPARAKELMAEAGYQDTSAFPEVTFIVNVGGDAAPGAHQNVAEAVAKMWQETLGVKVKIETIPWSNYGERLNTNPPDIYRLGWIADYNDPQNFLGDIFEQSNYGQFENSDYFNLVNKAGRSSGNPLFRQELYLQAEQILCETEAAIIPLYHYTYRP
jgi:ABC-type oligopeptide transport system substrate-binding subunit